jgi:hypothetical protein
MILFSELNWNIGWDEACIRGIKLQRFRFDTEDLGSLCFVVYLMMLSLHQTI